MKAAIDYIDPNKINIFPALLAIEEYLHKTYHLSKQNRICLLKQLDVEDILVKVLVAVYPLQKTVPIQVIASILATQLNQQNEIDGVTTALELLVVIAKVTDFYTLTCKPELTLTSNMEIAEEFRLQLELEHFPLPESTPCIRKDNTGSILGKYSYHNKKISLDVLNKLQAIPLEIDETLLHIEEIPDEDWNIATKLAMKKFNEDTIKLAPKYPLHFLWQFDSRGRMYSKGYHFNIQGNKRRRAMISLANKEIIEC